MPKDYLANGSISQDVQATILDVPLRFPNYEAHDSLVYKFCHRSSKFVHESFPQKEQL